MKKIIFLIISCLFLFSGCVNQSCPQIVEDYLNKFKNHNEEVLKSLDILISYENLGKEEQDQYRIIMRRQYHDLQYKTVAEYYNGNEAKITEEIEVYDYLSSKRRAKEYFEEHRDTMTTLEYKKLQLDSMYQEKNRIKYTIEFELHYEDDTWKLVSPNYVVLQKIHGIYEYE